MNGRTAIRLLQIVLGLVLCAYSVDLVIAHLHAAHYSHVSIFLLALGIAEAVGAALFLLGHRLGGPLLLATFAVAAAFHLLHGDIRSLGTLAIYAASVLAVMTNK